MKVLTYDLETENHKKYKKLASPFNPDNYIVEAGWSWNGGARESIRFEENHRTSIMDKQFDVMKKGDLLCGFNIKFDNLWVWGQESFQRALKRGMVIYCGQYAEYLLGGMVGEVQMVAMNDIAEKYGGGCKLDAVKELWQEGYLTSQVPPDLLHDYLVGDGKELIGDVHNTWLIYQGQVKRMKAEHPKEFITMFKHRMDGLLATTEMEYNGVYVDSEIGEELQKRVAHDLGEALADLESFIPEIPSCVKKGETEVTPNFVFNWNSNVHKSALIFGGTVKYRMWKADSPVAYTQKTVKFPVFNGTPVNPTECKLAGTVYVRVIVLEENDTRNFVVRRGTSYEVQDTYLKGQRAGQVKTKNVQVDDLTKMKGKLTDFYFTMTGYTEPKAKWQGVSTDAYDNPLYSVGADVIEELSKRGLPFTDALAKQTSLAKDLGTYYWAIGKGGKKTGMLTLVDEHGIIHHSLHHVRTVTSRTSSTDPNLQNIPKGSTSQVKQMFLSRFKKGMLAEIDYSQVEIVVQAMLTKDKQLTKDLLSGVDFHCKRLATKLGKTYKEVYHLHHVLHDSEIAIGRNIAKIFSFRRAYGAGAASLVETTGMSKAEVDNLIKQEDIDYPLISAFDRDLERRILRNKVDSTYKLFLSGNVYTQHESHWDSPTGTRYKWREDISPEFMHKHGKFTSFSPTQRKNYPAQGTAGEIMQTMLGKVFRYFLENDMFNREVLMVNTVHDCVVLDGKNEEVLSKVSINVQRILESVPEVFNKAFPDTLNIVVPFPCETEIGKTLFKMTELVIK